MAFTVDQWVIVLLVFLLGLFIGGSMFAGTKWKRRYREDAARRAELEAENKKLRKEAGEMESLRHAARKNAVDRDRDRL